MNHPIRLKTIAPPLFMTLTLLCFGLSPTARALLPPPAPDGGYPGGNTAEGDNALHDLTIGLNNTAVGASALGNNTTGGWNVAVGGLALASNTTGQQNMAIGAEALTNNNASFNLAIGFRTLFMNTTGNHNTAVGAAALRNNTNASDNTAVGAQALEANIDGTGNTAVGFGALTNNLAGGNTAVGINALFFNSTGSGNTAIGSGALTRNTIGERNTAVGDGALSTNTVDFNTAVGANALMANTGGFRNTAIGDAALQDNTTGTDNIAIGVDAGEALTGTESFNIDIANSGVTGDADTIRIGAVTLQIKTFIAGIRNKTTGINDAIPVVIDSAGQLGTMSSSRRFKKEIKPMEQSSEAILALKPVTFHYKNDTKGIAQFGLIAEEVAQVNPDLVVCDDNGEVYTVRYDAVNAMLLNEFLKEHRTVQELKSNAAKQDATIAQQQKQIEALSLGLQRVSAQLEASKPAPQVVNNP